MRQSYRWLTVALVLCGAAAAAGGLALLATSRTADVDAETGKWLLTVSAGLVITGALSLAVKQIDQRRNDRESWHGVLNDLVAANQTVMLARLRLTSHRTAKSYHEQLEELMGARVELRRMNAIGMVIGDPTLRGHISAMREYLDALGREYEREYLAVARQQRLDELWLSDQMKAACTGAADPALPAALAEPTQAWRTLMDPTRFPRLARLLDPDVFPVDVFRTNYKLAKRCLEHHAGLASPDLTASAVGAAKLATRARTFVSAHPDVPPALRERISTAVRALERSLSGADLRTIDDAFVEVNHATAEAISVVYAAPTAVYTEHEIRVPTVPTVGVDGKATTVPTA